MKTLRALPSTAGSLMVAALLLAAASATSAPAAGFVGGGTIGSLGSSGGHSATSGASVSHASVSTVGRGSSGSHLGVAGGYQNTGSLHPITATYSGPPHYLPGGFTPNVFSHASIAHAGASRYALASVAAPTQLSSPRSTSVPPTQRAHNAWTDPAPASATGTNSQVRPAGTNRNSSGTILFPDATHDAFGNSYPSSRASGYSGASYGRHSSYRLRRRVYDDDFGYPGVLVGGYDPYIYGDAGGIADAANGYADAGLSGSVAAGDAPSAAAMNDLSRPYPTGSYPTVPDPDGAVNSAQPGGTPAQVPDDQNAHSNNGPDSLVEAVQAELSRRGYFGGKIDAVYNDATHAAIERFQADQRLPASGRINEATLHALQLD